MAKLLIARVGRSTSISPTRPTTRRPRSGWWRRLLDGKVGDHALDLLKTAVSQRWSAEANLVDAIEHVARLALLVRAERDGEVDEVEDQLFRFGRILDAQPRLATLLSDYTHAGRRPGRAAGQGARELGSGVNDTAAALLSQTVELLRGERADEAVLDLAEARGRPARRSRRPRQCRGRAAATHSATRLTEVLSRIYGHPVSVQLHVDPGLARRAADRRR